MNYVDGYVIAVPTAKREAYRQMAQDVSAVFKDHGALKVVECWGDDVPEGKVTSFSMAVQRKPDEAVVFSWIVWPSRKVRDEGMKKAMSDPRIPDGHLKFPHLWPPKFPRARRADYGLRAALRERLGPHASARHLARRRPRSRVKGGWPWPPGEANP